MSAQRGGIVRGNPRTQKSTQIQVPGKSATIWQKRRSTGLNEQKPRDEAANSRETQHREAPEGNTKTGCKISCDSPTRKLMKQTSPREAWLKNATRTRAPRKSPQQQETPYRTSSRFPQPRRGLPQCRPRCTCWRRERLAEAQPSGKRPERSFPGRHCCTLRIDTRQKGCTRTVLAVLFAGLRRNGKDGHRKPRLPSLCGVTPTEEKHTHRLRMAFCRVIASTPLLARER